MRRIPAMAWTSPERIEMNPSQQQRLAHLIRAGTTAQQLVARARTVLLAAAGWTSPKIAARVGVCVDNTARRWRHRWWVQPGTASPGDAKRSGPPPSVDPVQSPRSRRWPASHPKRVVCHCHDDLPGPGRAGRRRWDRRVGLDIHGATMAGAKTRSHPGSTSPGSSSPTRTSPPRPPGSVTCTTGSGTGNRCQHTTTSSPSTQRPPSKPGARATPACPRARPR
jgi:transposase-like protein